MSRNTMGTVLSLMMVLLLEPQRSHAQTATPTPLNVCCHVVTGTAWDSMPSYDAWGVVVDRVRHLVYSTDPTGNFLYVHQYDGTPVTVLTGLQGAVGLALQPGPTPGDLFVALRSPVQEVVRYNPDTWTVTGGMLVGGALRDLHADSDGNLYASYDSGDVLVYNESPTPTPVATLSGLQVPDGMVRSSDGFYVMDTMNNRVLRFGVTPGPVYGTPTVVATLTAPQGVAWDGNNYYVTNNSSYNVYDGNWNLVRQCNLPELLYGQDIALDETGAIYVADRSTRVHKFGGCITPMPTPPLNVPGHCYIYPSPVRGGRATVCYLMAASGRATITVWNEAAEKVLVVGDSKPQGDQSTALDFGKFPAGVYYYQIKFTFDLESESISRLNKFVLVR